MNTHETVSRAEKILSQPAIKVGSSVCILITKGEDGTFGQTATAFLGGESVYANSIDDLEQNIGDIESWRRRQAMDRIEKLRIEIAKATEVLA